MKGDVASIESSEQLPKAVLPKLGYSVKEAEKITGIGRTTLWKAITKGKLKHFKVGRRVLFSSEHLKEYLKSYER